MHRSPAFNYTLALGAMAALLALSNYLVQFEFLGGWLTWAAFTYPVVFLVTDLSNRFGGARFARRVVYGGFAVGVVLSVWSATARIAVASGSAFLCAQLLDVLVFDRLRNQQWWKAPVVSSAAASVVDTFLFFSLAFALTPVPWVTLALGDLVVKFLLVAVLIPPYRLVVQRFAG